MSAPMASAPKTGSMSTTTPSTSTAASAPVAPPLTPCQSTDLGDIGPKLKKDKTKKTKPKKKHKSQQTITGSCTPPDRPPEKILASPAVQASSTTENPPTQLHPPSATLTETQALTTVTPSVTAVSSSVGASGAELPTQQTLPIQSAPLTFEQEQLDYACPCIHMDAADVLGDEAWLQAAMGSYFLHPEKLRQGHLQQIQLDHQLSAIPARHLHLPHSPVRG